MPFLVAGCKPLACKQKRERLGQRNQQDKAQARIGAPNERESCFWLRPRTREVIGSGD